MLHRLAFGLVLATISLPAAGGQVTSSFQPPPFDMPNCLQGSKVVCDYAVFDGNGSSSGTLPLHLTGDRLPAIRSVELRSVPSARAGAPLYVLVFNYVNPQDLAAADL